MFKEDEFKQNKLIRKYNNTLFQFLKNTFGMKYQPKLDPHGVCAGLTALWALNYRFAMEEKGISNQHQAAIKKLKDAVAEIKVNPRLLNKVNFLNGIFQLKGNFGIGGIKFLKHNQFIDPSGKKALAPDCLKKIAKTTSLYCQFHQSDLYHASLKIKALQSSSFSEANRDKIHLFCLQSYSTYLVDIITTVRGSNKNDVFDFLKQHTEENFNCRPIVLRQSDKKEWELLTLNNDRNNLVTQEATSIVNHPKISGYFCENSMKSSQKYYEDNLSEIAKIWDKVWNDRDGHAIAIYEHSRSGKTTYTLFDPNKGQAQFKTVDDVTAYWHKLMSDIKVYKKYDLIQIRTFTFGSKDPCYDYESEPNMLFKFIVDVTHTLAKKVASISDMAHQVRSEYDLRFEKIRFDKALMLFKLVSESHLSDKDKAEINQRLIKLLREDIVMTVEKTTPGWNKLDRLSQERTKRVISNCISQIDGEMLVGEAKIILEILDEELASTIYKKYFSNGNGIHNGTGYGGLFFRCRKKTMTEEYLMDVFRKNMLIKLSRCPVNDMCCAN